MYKSTITKVIVALVAVLVVAIAGKALVGVLQERGSFPADSTEGTESIPETRPEPPHTQGNETQRRNDPPATEPYRPDTQPVTPPHSEPASSDRPVDPPVTSPSEQKAPSNFKKTYTLSSETGARINLILTVHATANTDGTVHLKAVCQLEHRSLWMGARTLSVKIGDHTFKQSTEAFADDNVKKHYTDFGTFEYDVRYGQAISVYALFPYNGVYDEKEIGNIEINTTLNIA